MILYFAQRFVTLIKPALKICFAYCSCQFICFSNEILVYPQCTNHTKICAMLNSPLFEIKPEVIEQIFPIASVCDDVRVPEEQNVMKRNVNF